MVTLFFEDPISVVDGDAVIAVAGHYGSSVSPGFEMVGPVPQGQVRGTDGTGAIVSLISPEAAVVRMHMLDYTEVEELPVEKFSVYPNPAEEALNIKLTLIESENTVINVIDISGKAHQTINAGLVNGDRNLTVDVSELSTGVYFVEVVNAKGKQVKKFIKK